MHGDSPTPVDFTPDEIRRVMILLLTSRNDSRALALQELRIEFPEVALTDLPIVARNLQDTLVGLLEFIQAMRNRFHEESPEWDDYFDRVIQGFALEE